MKKTTEDDVLKAADLWIRLSVAGENFHSEDQQDLDLLSAATVMARAKYKRALSDYFSTSQIVDDDVRFTVANAMIADEIAELLHGERP